MAVPPPNVALRSAAERERYLCMDGSAVTLPVAPGGGTVSTQVYVGSLETYNLVRHPDGSVSFGSTFQNTYLRMDGSDIIPGIEILGGGGVVNVQFGIGPYEKFLIRRNGIPNGGCANANPDRGTVGIESKHFPGRWLCFSWKGPGNIVVNVQGKFTNDCAFDLLLLN
ncbi:hypothetical protein EV426DRAFT_279155 [Tirmania nivea]|nr:hypothetical protein EV426DRAFT_279155 [Tirmania nivea]